jgi:hypothetical protein
MHDGTGSSSSLTAIDPGAVRLWDVGVRWYEVETRKGHYDWTRLDQLVTAAQASHTQVTMVVGGTPSFYSRNPWYVPPRAVPAYRAFVKALMKRYKKFHGARGIDAYQVWDEANITTFWTGTPHEMARLTMAMSAVRNRFDRHAKVVAPSMVTRLDYQQKGLSDFFAQHVGGKPVWRYVDAIGLSMYPLPTYGRRTGVPEDSMTLLRRVRGLLHRDGVPRSKAIWSTEINYGLQSGKDANTPAKPITKARQAANVVRTYLLNAANGVKRVFWYRYDMGTYPGGGTIANTLLTRPNHPDEVTAAGTAFVTAQAWMHGRLLGSHGHRPCRKDRHGTYTCVVKDKSGKRHIYWNPFRTARVTLPRRAHHLHGVLGGSSDVKPGSRLEVGFKPVMVD